MDKRQHRVFQSLPDTSSERLQAAMSALIVLVALFFSLPLQAQDVGPLPAAPPQDDNPNLPQPIFPQAASQPTPKSPATPEPQHYESAISTAPPDLPVAQIIQKFAENEEIFKEERDNFTYAQDFLVETIDDHGQPDGEYHLRSDITFTPSGGHYEQIVYAPPPTLERISLSEQDLDDLKNIQPFVLTTAQLPKYDITYVGRQKLDEIGTYVFDVAPKRIEKNQRYFQGRIWVDDKYLEIVKTYGKAVPDIRRGSMENLFPLFETYRQNIEGHYWFPTYTHSDEVMHFESGDVHVRMTVRYYDYKRFRVSVRLLSPGQADHQSQPNPPAPTALPAHPNP